MPLAAYFVWLLVAMLLLRFGPLVVAAAADAVAGIAALAASGPIVGARVVAMVEFLLAVLSWSSSASRQRSGLPAPLSEALLSDLRERLQARARIPALPTAGSRRAPCSPPTASTTPATSWSPT